VLLPGNYWLTFLTNVAIDSQHETSLIDNILVDVSESLEPG
jgi:hypothetical protein